MGKTDVLTSLDQGRYHRLGVLGINSRQQSVYSLLCVALTGRGADETLGNTEFV